MFRYKYFPEVLLYIINTNHEGRPLARVYAWANLNWKKISKFLIWVIARNNYVSNVFHKRIYSRPHYYAQLGNPLQTHFFAYSALIMGILKGSVGQFFNFIAQSQNFTGGLAGPNLPIRSKINVIKKRWYTLHLKENLLLTIFY